MGMLRVITQASTLVLSLTMSLAAMASTDPNSPLPALSKDMEMKDLDQVQSLVMKYRNQNLHMEDKEEELRVNLFDAIRVLFARRDHDGTRTKVMGTLRPSLGEDESDVMDRVVDDSIAALKDSSTPIQEQKTHFYILHNFIKEYLPRKKDFTAQLSRIKDAKIEITDKLKVEAKLSSMTDAASPSTAAARALGEKIEN